MQRKRDLVWSSRTIPSSQMSERLTRLNLLSPNPSRRLRHPQAAPLQRRWQHSPSLREFKKITRPRASIYIVCTLTRLLQILRTRAKQESNRWASLVETAQPLHCLSAPPVLPVNHSRSQSWTGKAQLCARTQMRITVEKTNIRCCLMTNMIRQAST